jgi:hypothetical protein
MGKYKMMRCIAILLPVPQIFKYTRFLSKNREKLRISDDQMVGKIDAMA